MSGSSWHGRKSLTPSLAGGGDGSPLGSYYFPLGIPSSSRHGLPGLCLRQGRNPTNQAGRSSPRSLPRHLEGFPGSWRAVGISSMPPVTPAAVLGGGRAAICRLSHFPSRCRNALMSDPPCPQAPNTRINHQSDPFHHLQINLSSGGVPAFPSCKIRVKNSFSPCTCPFEAKSVFYFYSPDFLMVGSSPGA